MNTRALSLLVVISCAALASGCGGDDGEGGDGGESEIDTSLVDRLAAGDGTSTVAYADVAAMREQLGLPADADAGEFGEEGGSQRRLFFDAGYALRWLLVSQETPLSTAVDGTQVQAGAAGPYFFGESATAVIETDQPFEEIASALEKEGYEEEGGLLVNEGDLIASIVYSIVGDAGNGIVVLGNSTEHVEAAMAEPQTEHPVNALLDKVEGPLRTAVKIEGLSCLTGLAIGQSYDPLGGELVLELSEEADPDAFALADQQFVEFARYSFEEPQADGNELRVGITNDPEPAVGPMSLVSGDLPAGTIYDC